MKMDYEGLRICFGTVYYYILLQGKGLLFVDQQLTAGEEIKTWVRAYASDVFLFQKDFSLTMNILSNLQVPTAPMGKEKRRFATGEFTKIGLAWAMAVTCRHFRA
ncbi:putative Peroxidase 48 [Forsythia ovata]|uniref:Peroxidase 48 n=1 Tax=Forsythia ovata TaxID=205694 RepID=A0ABD1NVB4_9LAMI